MPNLSQTPQAPARAFTLIELMVVIVLIGILSAAILPAMRGTYDDAVLRSSGRELMNVFQLAYSRAVTLNQVQRVHIDETTGRYVLESQMMGLNDSSQFSPARDVPGGDGTLNSRVAVSVKLGNTAPEEAGEVEPARSANDETKSDETAFAFYPDGTADAGEIRLTDQEGFRVALRINPVTARVRVLELPRE